MDPASVAGIIAATGQILRAIYQYGEGVLECKSEVSRLRAELYGINAALSQIEQDLAYSKADPKRSLASPNLASPESAGVLEEARNLLVPFASSLDAELSSARRLARKLVWPLKRHEVRVLGDHIERFKTYFILAATNDTLHAARGVAESLQDLHLSVKSLEILGDKRLLRTGVEKWLSAHDAKPAHESALAARVEDTNAWFVKGIFEDWASGESQLLWLKGKPGSGKTCILSACANNIIESPKKGIAAYSYCSYNNASTQESRSTVAAFISQLYQRDPLIEAHVLKFYKDDPHARKQSLQTPADLPTLVTLIGGLCADAPRDVFLFLDGVDECAEGVKNLLDAVFQVLSKSTQTKLMLTSTESVATLVRTAVEDASLVAFEVDMSPSGVMRDIDTYIEARFRQETKLSKLRPQIQDMVKTDLREKHGGSFRWAQCTIDGLARLSTANAIKQALRVISPGLSDVYLAILDRIPDDMTHIAQKMLTSLVACYRPLSLGELAEAAIFTSPDDFTEDDRLIEPESFIRHLGSLVRYEPVTQKVELSHSSVRDFLESSQHSGKHHISPKAARYTFTRVCVDYLCLPDFQKVCPGASELDERKADWPLFEYAAFFWTRHMRSLVTSEETNAAVLKLFASADLPKGGNLASWYQCVYPQGHHIAWRTNPLYVCAREGMMDLLKIILPTIDRAGLEKRGGSRGSTALHVAATYGEVEAVRMLLAAGADPNERNDYGENGIQWAAFFDHKQTVEVLLKGGADPALLRFENHSELLKQMYYHASIPSERHSGRGEEE